MRKLKLESSTLPKVTQLVIRGRPTVMPDNTLNLHSRSSLDWTDQKNQENFQKPIKGDSFVFPRIDYHFIKERAFLTGRQKGKVSELIYEMAVAF